LRAAWRASYPGLAMAGIFSVFINVLKLAAPLFVLQTLNRVISSGSIETLVMLTAITLIAIVCGVLLEVVRRRMFMHWADWIQRTFGPVLFTSGFSQDSEDSPTSSSNLRDLERLSSFAAGQSFLAWLDIPWAPVFVVIVFYISPVLGYVTLVGCLLAIALGVVNELVTRETRNAAMRAGNESDEWLDLAERNREAIGSLSEIRGVASAWRRSAFERLDKSMRTRRLNVYFSAAMRMVSRFLRVALLAIGIWQVVENSLTVGALIAASILGRTAYGSVRDTMQGWRELTLALRAYQRIKKSLMRTRVPSISRRAEVGPSRLTLEDVWYRYRGQGSSMFRGLNIRVKPGQLLCVIGPSGSGKTTISRLACGLLAPRSGAIWLGELPVHRLQESSTHREIGYLAQEVVLFPGTVRENISTMATGDIELVTEAARLAGIHETILRLPQGYDTQIVEKEPLLSAGQRKGVAIARAVYGIPRLVVLDEPAPHLDSTAWEALLTGIEYLKSKGTILVMTTQQEEQAIMADKVIWLNSDRVVTARTREKVIRLMDSRRDRSAGNRSRETASDSGRERRDSSGPSGNLADRKDRKA